MKKTDKISLVTVLFVAILLLMIVIFVITYLSYGPDRKSMFSRTTDQILGKSNLYVGGSLADRKTSMTKKKVHLFFIGEYEDIILGWRIEFLVKPFCEWEESDTTGVEYGLYLFPSVNLVPQGNLVYSLSSIISPLDLSAHTSFGVSWNIYEELTLLGYASVQTGEAGDVFNLDNPVGLSFSLGGRYVY